MEFNFLYLGIVLLIAAIVMYVLGLRGTAYFTEGIGRMLIWLFVVIFIITLLFRLIS